MKTYLTIGLMSGTSMDGIDAALLETNGEAFVKSHGSIFLPYDPKFQRELKYCEQIVRQGKACPITTIKKSTELHIQAVKQLLEMNSLMASDIKVIGYHGQTLYHSPQNKITIQVGNAAQLAEQCGIDVIYDFRKNDIEHGGQGAPFAPLYHQALALRDKLIPCLVLNCGGISNVTYITETSVIAFDIGPGNGLLDEFIKLKTNHQYQMDKDGEFSQQGQVREKYIKILYEQSCQKNFYQKSPPKSLDINDLQLPEKIMELSLEDGAATLAYFTALCIYNACASGDTSLFQVRNSPEDLVWILAGGGWKNPTITHWLKTLLTNPGNVHLAKELGWDGDGLEAEIFAYLAIRSLKSLPLSLPSTTGVLKACTGGVYLKGTDDSSNN